MTASTSVHPSDSDPNDAVEGFERDQVVIRSAPASLPVKIAAVSDPRVRQRAADVHGGPRRAEHGPDRFRAVDVFDASRGASGRRPVSAANLRELCGDRRTDRTLVIEVDHGVSGTSSLPRVRPFAEVDVKPDRKLRARSRVAPGVDRRRARPSGSCS